MNFTMIFNNFFLFFKNNFTRINHSSLFIINAILNPLSVTFHAQGLFQHHLEFKEVHTILDKIQYLGGVLAPSSHCRILIETPLVREASRENDLSIAPMGLTDLKFEQLRLYF